MQSRQQRHGKPEVTRGPGTKQLLGSALTSSQEHNNPEGAPGSIAAQPFGSAAAAAPAFGGPPAQPEQAAGSAQKVHRDSSSAETASLARIEGEDRPPHSGSAGAMDAQPPPGPFGRTTGLSLDMACEDPDCLDKTINQGRSTPKKKQICLPLGLRSTIAMQSATIPE